MVYIKSLVPCGVAFSGLVSALPATQETEVKLEERGPTMQWCHVDTDCLAYPQEKCFDNIINEKVAKSCSSNLIIYPSKRDAGEKLEERGPTMQWCHIDTDCLAYPQEKCFDNIINGKVAKSCSSNLITYP